MQSGDITGSEKLVKTKLREVHWYQEFGGLKYWVDQALTVFFYLCTPTYSLVD